MTNYKKICIGLLITALFGGSISKSTQVDPKELENRAIVTKDFGKLKAQINRLSYILTQPEFKKWQSSTRSTISYLSEALRRIPVLLIQLKDIPFPELRRWILNTNSALKDLRFVDLRFPTIDTSIKPLDYFFFQLIRIKDLIATTREAAAPKKPAIETILDTMQKLLAIYGM